MNTLFPVFALLAWTIAIAMRMGMARYGAVMNKRVDPRYYEAYTGDEPTDLRILSRHFTNLLETPPLFYVVCIIAHVTGQSGAVVVGLAWAYVALRMVHTLIHLGSNVVIWRFRVFVASILVLTVLGTVVFAGLL